MCMRAYVCPRVHFCERKREREKGRERGRATKTLSYTHIPTISIIHLKRLILGKKIQTHVPFDTVLDMKPYLAPGHASPQTMEQIGIIAHQGTKEQGHVVTITKKGNEWISHNDAITTQTTPAHLHQSQAYVLMYRKIKQSTGTERKTYLALQGHMPENNKPA